MKIPKLLKKVILAGVFVFVGVPLFYVCFWEGTNCLRQTGVISEETLQRILFSEMKTHDARKTYRHWAGKRPPADMEVLAGQFYGAYPLFLPVLVEHTAYLKLKPSQAWWDQFVKQKKLVQVEDSSFDNQYAPAWFQPSNNSIHYRTQFHLDSKMWRPYLYFRDPETGIVYIFDWSL